MIALLWLCLAFLTSPFKSKCQLECIGGYFTMDPVRAALAVQFVKPDHVIPDHYGTFKLLAGTPAEFRVALKKRHLAKKLIVMKPGEDHSF